jgi:hypothetical protein
MRFNRKAIRRGAVSIAAAAGVGVSSPVEAATQTWIGGLSGNWNIILNWAFDVPDSNDTALFNATLGARTVHVDENRSVGELNVRATASPIGPYTFTCFNGAVLTCGLLDINSAVNTNTTIFDGFAINPGTMFVHNDATLTLTGGTQLNANTLALFSTNTAAPRPTVNINDGTLRLGTTGSISMGQIVLNPSGNLDLAANSELTVRLTGVLQLNRSFTLPGSSTIRVEAGGYLNSTNFLDIVGTGSGAGTMVVDGSAAIVEVGGAGASVTDWANGSLASANVTISNNGRASYFSGLRIASGGGTGIVNVGTNGGLLVFNGLTAGGAGVASITLNDNSLLFSDGTTTFSGAGSRLDVLTNSSVIFNNDATFSTGTTLNWSGGTVSIASGRTLNIAGGTVNNNSGGQQLPGGVTLRITRAGGIGGQFINNSFFDVARTNATGTLIVDGVGSRITTPSVSQSDWGLAPGRIATATFTNSGAGTFDSLTMSIGGGSTTVNLQSGGALNVLASLETGTADSSGKALINIAGGLLRTTGTANFMGGTTVNLSGGSLSVNNATFTQGSTLNWTGGDVVIGGALVFNRGVASVTLGRALPGGATLAIVNAGQFVSTSFFDVANGAGTSGTLLVSGPGSLYQTQGATATDWGSGSGVAHITITDSALASMTHLRMGTSDAHTGVFINLGGVLSVDSLLAGESAAGFTGTASINLSGGGLTAGTASFQKGIVVNVQAGGSLIFGGNATFGPGSQLNWSGGTWNNANGTTLTFSGAAASFTKSGGGSDSGRGLSNGSTLRVRGGGTLTTNSYFDIGSSATGGATGTLLVDGAQFILNANLGNYTDWGLNDGNAATVTFSNSAFGSYAGGLQIGANGGAATVSLQSSSNLTTTFLNAGTTGASNGVNLTINNANLFVNEDLTLRNGVVVNYSAGSVFVVQQLAMSGDSKVLLGAGADRGLRTGGLSMSGTSKIDLSDNAMIIDYTGASPLATITAYLAAGRNGGNWLGDRLTSSAAALDSTHVGLGIGEASIVLGPSGGVFSSYNVDSSTVLVKFTYLGDTDLDGDVDVADLGNLASHWQTAGVWTDGDFDYSGSINVNDLGMLATNWQAGVGAPLRPSLSDALASLGLPSTSVPEPSLWLLFSAPLLARCTHLRLSRAKWPRHSLSP